MSKRTQDRDDAASARRQQAAANYNLELARQERRRGGVDAAEARPAKAEPPEPTPTNIPGEPADRGGAHLGALHLLLDALDDNGI